MKYLLKETLVEYLTRNDSFDQYMVDLKDTADEVLRRQDEAITTEAIDLQAINKYVYVKNHFRRVGRKVKIETIEAAELTLDEFVDMFINEHPESREVYNKLVAMLIK